MKKYFILLAASVTMLYSCNSGSSDSSKNASQTAQTDSLSSTSNTINLDTTVNSIIEISASDFYKNQKPTPVDFKDVTLKYIKKTDGEELYILCGLFVTEDKQEIQFATIKNYDYEQWIGTNARTYCQDSKEIPYTKLNLTEALKEKFNSLKNN